MTGGDFISLRDEMVTYQIEGRGVRDKDVLAAMRKVERHRFVPEKLQGEAYEDCPLPIGHGQTISQPYIVALMTELLRPQKGHRVLEIGTGSGYQTAVLAEIVKEVLTVERVQPLADGSRLLLEGMGYKNIQFFCRNGYNGLEEHAPYDGIIVTACPPSLPRPLLVQLAAGGRLVIPVGELEQNLMLYHKKDDGAVEEELVFPVRFVRLVDG